MSLIYILEDDANIREIEMITLKSSGHTVYEFDNAEGYFQRLSIKRPDLAIIDLMLPDKDGYQVVKEMRANSQYKKIPIIMITAKTSEMDMIKGFDVGADDYIKKPFSVIELITRVKALLRRTQEEMEENQFCIGAVELNDQRHEVVVNSATIELTYKEYELLKLLMKNQGLVMTREMIMNNVWSTDFEGETRTVDMHIKTLRKKMGESGQLIRTIRNVGYVMEA